MTTFAARCGRACKARSRAEDLKAASLWQRKLGMGHIFEWELRLRCEPDPERLDHSLDVFAEQARVAAPRITERGRQLLFQRIA